MLSVLLTFLGPGPSIKVTNELRSEPKTQPFLFWSRAALNL